MGRANVFAHLLSDDVCRTPSEARRLGTQPECLAAMRRPGSRGSSPRRWYEQLTHQTTKTHEKSGKPRLLTGCVIAPQQAEALSDMGSSIHQGEKKAWLTGPDQQHHTHTAHWLKARSGWRPVPVRSQRNPASAPMGAVSRCAMSSSPGADGCGIVLLAHSPCHQTLWRALSKGGLMEYWLTVVNRVMSGH